MNRREFLPLAAFAGLASVKPALATFDTSNKRNRQVDEAADYVIHAYDNGSVQLPAAYSVPSVQLPAAYSVPSATLPISFYTKGKAGAADAPQIVRDLASQLKRRETALAARETLELVGNRVVEKVCSGIAARHVEMSKFTDAVKKSRIVTPRFVIDVDDLGDRYVQLYLASTASAARELERLIADAKALVPSSFEAVYGYAPLQFDVSWNPIVVETFACLVSRGIVFDPSARRQYLIY